VKQSRSIPLLASLALPIWGTLYLLHHQIIVLTMNSVTTWVLWRFVHEVSQVSLLWIFRFRCIFLPLLPPIFKSSRMTSWQNSQTSLKHDTFHKNFGCLNNTLSRDFVWIWEMGYWFLNACIIGRKL